MGFDTVPRQRHKDEAGWIRWNVELRITSEVLGKGDPLRVLAVILSHFHPDWLIFSLEFNKMICSKTHSYSHIFARMHINSNASRT